MIPTIIYNKVKYSKVKYSKDKSYSILSYAFQQSDIIVVPGRIQSLITCNNVSAVRFSTTTKKLKEKWKFIPPIIG